MSLLHRSECGHLPGYDAWKLASPEDEDRQADDLEPDPDQQRDEAYDRAMEELDDRP